MKNARFADDPAPLDGDCSCPACCQFSRAYFHHLVKSGEIIAAVLLTWHNLAYYQKLMGALRQAESRLADCAESYYAACQDAGAPRAGFYLTDCI